MVTSIPAVTPPIINECAMLFAPSPKYDNRRPLSAPLRSASVCRSASTWHGWNSSESALTIGTLAPEAIDVSRSCPNVRQTIAST